MSLEDKQKLQYLREVLHKEYEFWLGCYLKDQMNSDAVNEYRTPLAGERWKSGIIHAYRNTLREIDVLIDNEKRLDKINCPCHICVAMKR